MYPSRDSQGQEIGRQVGRCRVDSPVFLKPRGVGRLRRGGRGRKAEREEWRRERLQGRGEGTKWGGRRVKGRRNKGRSGKNIIWELGEKRIGGKGRGRGREEAEIEQLVQE